MKKDDYVARISNATPLGLVIINYDLIIENVEDAKKALLSGDVDAFQAHITKSRDFLMLLMKSLDFNYEISKDLVRTYIHINSLLIKSFFSKKTEPLEAATDLLSIMLKDWKELLKFEDAKPVMENAQQLYAGLTYKNGELSEYIPDDKNRGFKV